MPTAAQEPPPDAAGEADAEVGQDVSESTRTERLVFGGIFVGLGAAAVIAGAVVAGVAASRYGSLDCPDNVCPPDRHADADAYNRLRVPAGVTLGAGLVLTAVGLATLLAPSGGTSGGTSRATGAAAKPAASAEGAAVIEPLVGPGAVGVRGRF
jgi:hypothetical protein